MAMICLFNLYNFASVQMDIGGEVVLAFFSKYFAYA